MPFNEILTSDVDDNENGNVSTPPNQDDSWDRDQEANHPAAKALGIALIVILLCIGSITIYGIQAVVP